MADIVGGVDMSPVPCIDNQVVAVVPWADTPDVQTPGPDNPAGTVAVGQVHESLGGVWWAVVTPAGAQFQMQTFEDYSLAEWRARQLGWLPCPWGERGGVDCAAYGPRDCRGVRCGHPRGSG